MNAFSSAPLSQLGVLIHLNEEVILKTESNVTVYEQDGKEKKCVLFSPEEVHSVVLTNMRVVIIVVSKTSSPGSQSVLGNALIGWGINLSSVLFVEDCVRTFLHRSTRLRLGLKAPNGAICDVGLGLGREGLGDEKKVEWLELIQRALHKKSWEAMLKKQEEDKLANDLIRGVKISASTSSHSSSLDRNVLNVGVGGLIDRQKNKLSDVKDLTIEATTDLESLMQKARDVVQIVDRYAKYRDSLSSGKSGTHSSSTSNSSTTTSNNEDDIDETSSISTDTTTNEVENVLQSIGMVSPVTKYSAGRRYHQQLARQVADMLVQQRRLTRMGGMITLTDLYCIVNKARGTELVSPDDLYRCTKLMDSLKLGMRLVTFRSGVKVIQSDDLGEDALCRRIMDLYSAEMIGFRIDEIASALGITLVIAKEQVMLVENKGLLCRDESVYGITFYKNIF